MKRRTPKALWLSTSFTLLALILALGGVLYYIYRDWLDEQQDNLIQEVLWLEQSLRLHLEGNQEWAEALANDIAGGQVNSQKFAKNASFYIRENPDILAIQRIDAAGRVLWDAHGKRSDGFIIKGDDYQAVWRAQRLRRPSYGDPYMGQDEKYRFDLAAPVVVDGQPLGSVRVIYQFDALLYYQVPWWIASKNYISIVDLGGKPLASKFDPSEHPGNISHQTSFDPPGYGLFLKAVSYRSGLGVAIPAMSVAVILLAFALIYSVWRIRQHMRQRSNAEHALAVEVSLRQAIEDCMKSGLVAIGLQGEIVRVNRAFCEMLGYSSDELIGQAPPHIFWPADGYDQMQSAMEAVREGMQPEQGFELRFQTKMGEFIEVRLYATPLIERDGSHRGWIASLFDITERKRQRLALNASHQRFLTVLNGLQAGVCVIDADTRQLLYANPTFAHLWLHQDVYGACCVLLPHGQDVPSALDDDGSVEFAENDGREWFQLHRRKIDWVHGESAWLVILTNITDDKQREESEQSQQERFQNTLRLIAMGEIASSLAHELNQPLTAINTYASGLVRRLKPEAGLPVGVNEAIQAISDQAKRAAQIISSIRAFVKKHEPQLERVDPAKVLAHAVALAEVALPKFTYLLSLEQQEAKLQLDMDPVLIEQVVINLIKNAVEAMQDAGTKKPEVRVRTTLTDMFWRVEVLDNGPGLSDGVQGNLFTPFYSTKTDGMGIGLNICRSIIEFHRGQFGVDSSEGKGCIFWFTLPLSN